MAHQVCKSSGVFFVPRPRYRLPAQCNFMLISAFFSSVILLFYFLFFIKNCVLHRRYAVTELFSGILVHG